MLIDQHKISIEELSGGGCEIRNLVQSGSPHIKSLTLDTSVEDPIVINLGDEHEYEVDIENAFGIAYSGGGMAEKIEKLGNFIHAIYEGGVKVKKGGILGRAFYIQAQNEKYKARKIR